MLVIRRKQHNKKISFGLTMSHKHPQSGTTIRLFLPSQSKCSTCDQHKPEAPAQSEADASSLDEDGEGPLRQHHAVPDAGPDQQGTGQSHRVGTVAGNRHQKQVHQQPRGKCGPANKEQELIKTRPSGTWLRAELHPELAIAVCWRNIRRLGTGHPTRILPGPS